MSTSTRPDLGSSLQGRDLLLEWLPIVVGFAVLYVPSFYGLFTGIWMTEEQAHGPIILLLAFWLIWRQRERILAVAQFNRAPLFGWVLFVAGLLIYIVGRSQQILAFEIGSFVMLTAAILVLKLGVEALRVAWFPFFFMLFMIPLPSSVVSALTLPMKMAVSYVCEHILYWFGYPIARTGVIL